MLLSELNNCHLSFCKCAIYSLIAGFTFISDYLIGIFQISKASISSSCNYVKSMSLYLYFYYIQQDFWNSFWQMFLSLDIKIVRERRSALLLYGQKASGQFHILVKRYKLLSHSQIDRGPVTRKQESQVSDPGLPDSEVQRSDASKPYLCCLLIHPFEFCEFPQLSTVNLSLPIWLCVSALFICISISQQIFVYRYIFADSTKTNT